MTPKKSESAQNTPTGNKSVSCQAAARLRSPAKVNLGLSIVGRRSDGYHLIESLFWPIDWYDDIEIQTLKKDKPHSISANWSIDAPYPNPSLPHGKDNLVHAVTEGTTLGKGVCWDVRLNKRIPMGAGLGGGSSNAGTVLRYLGSQMGVRIEEPSRFGADIPFFLNPEPSWVSGIGDVCQTVGVSAELTRELSFLVVLPPKPMNTRQVFEAYRSSKIPFSKSRPRAPTSIVDYLNTAQNDLEPIVIRCYPLVGKILAALRKTPCLYAGVSGAGSSCVAVYGEKKNEKIKVLYERLRQDDCKTVTAGTYRG